MYIPEPFEHAEIPDFIRGIVVGHALTLGVILWILLMNK